MRIIFIYNADSDFMTGIFDVAKKATGNSQCALCDITWTLVKEKEEWKKVDRSLGVETVYYHRDEIPNTVRTYLEKNNLSLPIVLLENQKRLTPLVMSDELRPCKGEVICLEKLLTSALKKYK